VFQAHIGFFDGHKLHHYPCLEFNSTKEIDPAKAIARHLLEIISLDLPVIVYTSFEELRISDLINKYPDHKINLEKLKRNLWDLHEVFKDATVIHPSAEGKTSLKNIIKAFSKKSYSSLEINNGLAASAAYAELINPMTKSVTQRRIVRQLIEYNKFDVEATQIIIEGLFKLLRRKDG